MLPAHSGQKPNVRGDASQRCPRSRTLDLHRNAPRRNPFTAPRKLRILAALAFAWILAVQIPLASTGPRPGSATPSADSEILFRTNLSPAEVLAVGGQIVEDYGGFLVARGPAGLAERLQAEGHRADEIHGSSVIHFLDGPLDVSTLAPGRPDTWIRDANGRSVGVVHFHAPIKTSWKEELASLGVDVLRYVPRDAFLVRGSPSALQSLRSLPYVDWVGSYDASRKIRAGMQASGIADVRIALFPGEATEGVVAWLAHRGLSTGTKSESGPAVLGTFGLDEFRWVRARVPASLLPDLANLASVEFIDPVRPAQLLNAETDWVMQTNASGDYRYWTNGLDGRGQVVGIADTGVDYDGAQFRQSSAAITIGDLYNATDASRRKIVRYVNMGVLTGQLTWPGGGGSWDPWSIMDTYHLPGGSNCTFGHGTAVASTLAGNDNGIGTSVNDGNALAAKVYVQDVGTIGPSAIPGCKDEDSLLYLPEDLQELFGPAGLVYNDPLAAVRIHSDSWGTATNVYDLQAQSVDAFVWNHPDFLVLFAVGNNGSAAATVDTPATAKDLLAVGGAYNPDTPPLTQNDLAFLSSRGPTTDGRIKPTLLSIFDGDSAMSDGNPWSGVGLADSQWQGTSYSTPAAAAAAAIVRQYFVDGWYPMARPVAGNGRTPSAALLRAALIASGVQITGSGAVRSGSDTWPNNEQGFGRILLANILPIAAEGDTFATQIVDDAAGLLTGDVRTYRFNVVNGARPAKFVLAWSDYPAALGAAKALVNDVDLEVTAPDGTVYRGNRFGTFAQGQSVPGGSFDTTNVEEAVIVRAPAVGVWTVRVIGSDVPVGPQPFALVATGNLDAAYGRVSLDRSVYSESDAIGIQVEDVDATSVQVRAASTVEPAGEVVTLAKGSAEGIWRGTIATAFGPAAADGVLQVRDEDSITVAYADASPSHTDLATARVDAVGPVISAASADRIGTTGARIRWRTDEASTTGVRFGTSPLNLDSSTETKDLRTDHALMLNGLTPDTTYYYDIVSRDRLGHETRDANGGRHYRLRTAPWGDVLLVVGDASFPEEREASYAAALDGRGWTWSVWRIADSGPPPLGILRQQRAVLWQVGTEQYPAFDASSQSLVKAYLDGGGRLLVVSHDAAWSLGDAASPWYSAEGEAWIGGVLKASLQCDPLSALALRGAAGDPITGAYTLGVGYAPHRSGGADDELTLVSAGGTATTIWTDDVIDGCAASGGPVGLRWVSSAANGTDGVGAWGGRPSRLVYFAFELTGLDAASGDLNPGSPARAEVLDNALRWLVGTATGSLDRDHPDVRLTAPNGGTFTGPTLTITWTASSTGAALADVALLYSADAGQSWDAIATVPGADVLYAWDVSAVPNGDRYLVRAIARDAGAPPLKGEDVSDSPFALNRVGGDTVGPAIWAGSVHLSPNPPAVGSTVWINATADDTRSGSSRIVAAELFLLDVQPPPSADGTGLPMAAADGAFDGPVENLTWSGTLGVPLGASCLWVHARDLGGIWGPYGGFCPDAIPPAAAGLVGIRLANGQADVEVRWAPAPDDGAYGGTSRYRVVRSTTPRGTGFDVSGDVPATQASSYAFVDVGAGLGDPSDYFYRIESVDGANNTARTVSLAAKVRLDVAAGLNLLALSVETANRSLGDLAAGVAWLAAWTYDACGPAPGWSSATGATSSLPIGPGQGFWINASASGSLVAVGLVAPTVRVTLCEGWNLVGLPGFGAGITVAALRAATGADTVMGFDPADAYHLRILGDAEVLAPGAGFWAHVPAAAVWTVPGW